LLAGRFRTWFYDARVRAWISQAAVAGALVWTIWYFVANASENMVKAGIASGFDFLWRTSGIDVPFRIVEYSPQGNILSLLWVGIANTLLVAILGMIFATILGFLIGIARLSKNFLLRSLAGGYVEFVRNIPLLLFVFFWYFGVIRGRLGISAASPSSTIAASTSPRRPIRRCSPGSRSCWRSRRFVSCSRAAGRANAKRTPAKPSRCGSRAWRCSAWHRSWR
jgi:His/Glu/Gln/Arg/opine family amino acid ABC transporter permease subunit